MSSSSISSLSSSTPTDSPKITTRYTTCNRDCPDVCRIAVDYEDDKPIRLRGADSHPITGSALCYRTQQFLQIHNHAERITSPQYRKTLQDPWQTISWDEALDVAASELQRIKQESGPEAIFHYRSGGSLGLSLGLVDRFFGAFGPVTAKRGDICMGAGEAAQMTDFGGKDSNDIFDVYNAKHIIIWGKNAHVSSPHSVKVLQEARRRGARITLIDPLPHQGSRSSLCDVYWQIRPGTDIALALATARILFERIEEHGVSEHGVSEHGVSEHGVSEHGAFEQPHAQIDGIDGFRRLAMHCSVETWCRLADVPAQAAEGLADAFLDGPCAQWLGWGLGRRAFGSTTMRTLDALSMLSGNMGIEGGGASFYYLRRGLFDKTILDDGIAPPPRTISEVLLGQEILAAHNPPIRAVWITAGNPVAMLPDCATTAEALSSRDFVVVVDQFMTDTAQCAHLFLPVVNLLETDDLLGSYGHHYVGVARAAVSRRGEVRSDAEIIQGLAARVGLHDVVAGTSRQWEEKLLGQQAKEHGISLERLEDFTQPPVRNPLSPSVFVPTQKMQILSDDEVPAGFWEYLQEKANLGPSTNKHPESAYPLQLLSVSTKDSQSAQWSGPHAGSAPSILWARVHSDYAKHCGIDDQEIALLESVQGSIRVQVIYDDKQRHDVLLVPKGGHYRHQSSANQLIRPRLTDFGEGGALYDECVRLRKII